MAEISPDESPDGGNIIEFSVSELSFALKKAVEDQFSYVRVRGELGRISQPASGHIYLDLKDEKSVIAGVIWRGQASKLKIRPEQGLEVIVTGRLTTYPGQSKYQIVIESMEHAGVGALMALLEERKKKLAAEGLFDDARKQLLPHLPGTIGIVTSPTGAVIRDMIHGFTERFPSRVLVWPVRVQGETCKDEVAAAIRGFNALPEGGAIPRPDVIIVARGGGSLEDLWGFNEEIVARAAAESDIALISAVGHETDWTLIDLVADARAPTPTKAAEWAVPKFSELLERNRELADRLHISLRRFLEQVRARLTAAERGLPKPTDLIAISRQRFDNSGERLGRALKANTQIHITHSQRIFDRLVPALRNATQARRLRFDRTGARLTVSAISVRISNVSQQMETAKVRMRNGFIQQLRQYRTQVETQSKLLNSLGYQQVLARGFALVRRVEGQMVRSASEVGSGDELSLQFTDGNVYVKTLDEGGEPKRKIPETGSKKPKKTASKTKASTNTGSFSGKQGSLF